ncbi:DUF6328 family protein [Kitasatospora sp. NPDC101157]|uniref:DUF6328 family protein n=1 Tax=Kitasatospora sp. NPDC101157 TaxID=3364098 RepID=UPI00380DED9E
MNTPPRPGPATVPAPAPAPAPSVPTSPPSQGGRTRRCGADRLLMELLQRLRVLQTGVQIVLAFLLGIAFSPPCAEPCDAQQHIYVAMLLPAVLGATAAVAISTAIALVSATLWFVPPRAPAPNHPRPAVTAAAPPRRTPCHRRPSARARGRAAVAGTGPWAGCGAPGAGPGGRRPRAPPPLLPTPPAPRTDDRPALM